MLIFRSPFSLVFSQEKVIKYRSTWIAVIVAMVFTSLASIFLRYIYIRENRRRDDLAVSVGTSVEEDEQAKEGTGLPAAERPDVYEDKTDRNRMEYRYIL